MEIQKRTTEYCSVEWSHAEIYCKIFTATLQVKVFAWSPFGNQLFWFKETFLLSKFASSKNFRYHGNQNGCKLKGCTGIRNNYNHEKVVLSQNKLYGLFCMWQEECAKLSNPFLFHVSLHMSFFNA